MNVEKLQEVWSRVCLALGYVCIGLGVISLWMIAVMVYQAPPEVWQKMGAELSREFGWLVGNPTLPR